MNISYRKFAALSVCLFMVSSCSQAGKLMNTEIFQNLDLQNSGIHTVTDVKIVYGEHVFPIGFQSPIVSVPRIKGLLSFSSTASVPVPETAKIHWKSFDNQAHDIEVPIRSLITDWNIFQGFKFTFIDDHIELSIANHHEKPLPYGTLDYTKVYSSVDGLIKDGIH